MNKIYNNLSTDNLMKTGMFNQFSNAQRREITYGLENGLNVFVYSKKVFS